MDSRFFVDADPAHPSQPVDPGRPALRGGLIAPLAGLVAAVALFVTTLSVVAESQEAQAVAASPPPIAVAPLTLAHARDR